MIEGVAVRPLRTIADERGAILHFLRADDPWFEAFGEVYFSIVYPGVVKGWHRHREMTLNYAVPVGMAKVVLHDDRPGSPTVGETMEVHVGERNHCLVTVPPMVWNGFKGEGVVPAVVANCATIPHDPAEIERRPPDDAAIGYDWALRHS